MYTCSNHSQKTGTKSRTVVAQWYSGTGQARKQHPAHRALEHLLLTRSLQAKLTASNPADVHEQEADRVADEVMRAPEPSLDTAGSSPIQVERRCPSCPENLERAAIEEEEEKKLHAKLEGEPTRIVSSEVEDGIQGLSGDGRALSDTTRSFMGPRSGADFGSVRIHRSRESMAGAQQTQGPHGTVMRKTAGVTAEGTTTSAPARQADLKMSGSGGRPLPEPVRLAMEPRFGQKFSDVRVHDDVRTAETARSIGAVAYTFGRNIGFASGEFRPNTPQGLHLLAHELAHVVQQRGNADAGDSVVVGDVDDPLEQQADRAAESTIRGETVSPQAVGEGMIRRRVQRAVSKVCNPPSTWLALGGAASFSTASAFGAIAELFISTNVLATNGVAPGNFYLDNPAAGPIDPALVAFIISKNPGLSTADRIKLLVTSMVRPDVLMHQPGLTEFEEVKPNSIPGRYAGTTKVAALSGIYAGYGLPYTAGTTYVPGPPFVIVSGTLPGGIPMIVTFEVSRNSAGLLVYDLCIETDWLVASLLALAAIAIIIAILLSRGAIIPILLPRLPAFAAATPAGTPSGTPTEAAEGQSTVAGATGTEASEASV